MEITTFAGPLFCVVAAPNPDGGVGQGLLEYATVTVSCAASENKALVVTLGFHGGRSALAGHHPVVVSLLGIVGTQNRVKPAVRALSRVIRQTAQRPRDSHDD